MPARSVAAALMALTLAACAGAGAPPGTAPPARETGRAFAERACAGCHAVGPTGASPNPRAPTFRALARDRSDAALLAALREISRNGHVEMPPVYVTPEEMKALVAWMRSLTARAA